MASYYVNIFKRSTTGKIMAGAGSFNNITVDGRLSWENAIGVARECAMSECKFQGKTYLGFALAKSNRAWDYRNATVVDCDVSHKEILFLN